MKAVRFIINGSAWEIQVVDGTSESIEANCLVVTEADAQIIDPQGGALAIDFFAADFQRIHAELDDLLDPVRQYVFRRTPFRVLKADADVIRACNLLWGASRDTLLRFLMIYCLGNDRAYFSALLRQSMAGDQPLFDFIEANFLNSWPVARFAAEFGLSTRKFNFLFREKFGTSVKHWLLERRLEHARELLIGTSMRVFDVAVECGFSNHAHFTDSFRRRYGKSPSQMRQEFVSVAAPGSARKLAGKETSAAIAME